MWLIENLIPSASLTLVVGQPGAGKSSFGAYLCGLAKRPAILPGSEESVGMDLVPRLVAAGVDLRQCLILDGRQWSLPHDRDRLTETLVRHGADLLWADPIDTYVATESENDGPTVRAALESFVLVAQRAKCAVVAARHPGKVAGNLCPGSRQWRAVPRLIWSLTVDTAGEERSILSPWKPYAGVSRTPRAYTLIGEGDQPRKFQMGPWVSQAEVELASLSDPTDRRKIEEAIELLGALLAEEEMESASIYAIADKEKLSERVMRLAARRIGVAVRREGVGRAHRSYWSLRHSGTPAQ